MSVNKEYTTLDTLLGVRKELLTINKYMEEINSLIKPLENKRLKISKFSITNPYDFNNHQSNEITATYYKEPSIIEILFRILKDFEFETSPTWGLYFIENILKSKRFEIKDEKRLIELINEVKSTKFYNDQLLTLAGLKDSRIGISSSYIAIYDYSDASYLEAGYHPNEDTILLSKSPYDKLSKNRVERLLEESIDLGHYFSPYIIGLIESWKEENYSIIKDFEVDETANSQKISIREEGKRLVLSQKNKIIY